MTHIFLSKKIENLFFHFFFIFYCDQIVRDKISTCTVLLIAKHAQNLRFFHVRKNAVLLKCDWPRNPDWDDGYYEWLKFVSKSYEETEAEVSKMLGYRWSMLTDKEFLRIKVNVRQV